MRIVLCLRSKKPKAYGNVRNVVWHERKCWQFLDSMSSTEGSQRHGDIHQVQMIICSPLAHFGAWVRYNK